MRRTTLAALCLGIAAAVLPAGSAHAYCDLTWHRLTGDCNPCETKNRLQGRNDPCPR